MARTSATVIVTTHYDRLKALAPNDPRFVNASGATTWTGCSPLTACTWACPGPPERCWWPAGWAFRRTSPGVRRNFWQRQDRRGGTVAGVCPRAGVVLRVQQDPSRRCGRHRRTPGWPRGAGAGPGRAAQGPPVAYDDAIGALRKARGELDEARPRCAAHRRTRARISPDANSRRCGSASTPWRGTSPGRRGTGRPIGRPLRADEVTIGRRVMVPRLGGGHRSCRTGLRDKVVSSVGALKLNADVRETAYGRKGGGPPAAGALAPPAEAAFTQKAAAGGLGDAAGAAKAPMRRQAATLDLRGERVDVALARAGQVCRRCVAGCVAGGVHHPWAWHGGVGRCVREHFAAFP